MLTILIKILICLFIIIWAFTQQQFFLQLATAIYIAWKTLEN